MSELLSKKIQKEIFDEMLMKTARKAVIQQMLTGNCSIKISTDDSGNVQIEVINPFKGCECGE